MPSIQISRKHTKTMPQARAAVEKVAKKIAQKFDVDYGWDGDTMNFERSGVSGHIELGKGSVKVVVDLSFLLMAIKSPIQNAIEEHLDKEFS